MKVWISEFSFFCGSRWKRMNCRITATSKAQLAVEAGKVLKHMAKDELSLPEKLNQVIDEAVEEEIEYPIVELVPA